jgi:hypothetical protein
VENWHAFVWLKLSVAVQVTFVDPTGNRDPEAGEQVLVTGAAPPLTIGAGKLTATDAPSVDAAV